jgi:ectoine hydroxylase-related dioxygenase (phytanoyl-CoA dioxygenase family)
VLLKIVPSCLNKRGRTISQKMSTLSAGTKQRIDADGFAVIAGVLGYREMDILKGAMEKTPPHRSRAGARHMLGNASVAALASDPRLLEIARQVLGAEARPFRATLFDKSPTSNWLVVWHQDTALPLLERHEVLGWGPWSVKEGVIYAHAPATALQQILALRVHLDESSDRNGPLRVLPGTHLMGVLTYDAIEQLTSQIAAVDCLVAAGGVVAMRPLIVHASSKSLIETPRRVLHIEYAARMVTADSLELAMA